MLLHVMRASRQVIYIFFHCLMLQKHVMVKPRIAFFLSQGNLAFTGSYGCYWSNTPSITHQNRYISIPVITIQVTAMHAHTAFRFVVQRNKQNNRK